MKLLTTPSRSFNMSMIRSSDTKAELLLRRELWKKNIRFRVHSKSVIGKPVILINKYHLAVFVDGSFWHGYEWEHNQKKIKSNLHYWIPKIERNIQRDRQVDQALISLGYTVMRFWDHDIQKNLEKCVNQIMLFIESARAGEIPEKE